MIIDRIPLFRLRLFLLTVTFLFFVSFASHGEARDTAQPQNIETSHNSFKPAERFTTDFGLEVFLITSRANPMLEVQLLMAGGSETDPVGLDGLSSMTATMMGEGAGDLKADTFKEKLEFHGIVLGADASRDVTTIAMRTLSRHRNTAFSMMSEMVFRPRFDADSYERIQQQVTSGLIQRREKPGVRAIQALYRLLFRNHPYGHPAAGTPATVSQITSDHLKKRHRQWLNPDRMTLAVAGDIDRLALQRVLDTHFKPFMLSLPSKQSDTTLLRYPLDVLDEQATLHLAMDLPQTTIRLGFPGIARNDEDRYAVTVMSQILGGAGITSRLTEVLREKRGLTYGVYAYHLPFSDAGVFVISMKTKTKSAGEALSLLNTEVNRIQNERVSEEELQSAIDYLTGSFPIRQEGLRSQAVTWGRIGLFDYPLDYLANWVNRISQVSREDVLRVAQRILQRDKMQSVTVGKELPTQ
ncbi:MAG: insulinase family protein [Magnetococcales bacterium]|nr:insulinase family protein [Magnetococcales bacterium]